MGTALPDFIVHLTDLLAPLGDVRAKRMFGGYGLALDDAMLAIVLDGVLYLKVDDENEPMFDARGLGRFVYQPKNRGPVAMSFCEAPIEVIDDRAAMLEWARPALRAAERARAVRESEKAKRAASKSKREKRAPRGD